MIRLLLARDEVLGGKVCPRGTVVAEIRTSAGFDVGDVIDALKHRRLMTDSDPPKVDKAPSSKRKGGVKQPG
jgi:hypothetical protein